MADTYNQAQKEAIMHREGPAMVLAGPGSGKTTVITERVKSLIQDAGVNPASILVVTFTRAAAEEMKARFLRLSGSSSTTVTFGTFHSVFFFILKIAYHYSVADIITESKRYELFQEITEDLDLEVEDRSNFIHAIAEEVSLVKGENIDPSHYYAANCSDEVFREIYAAYNRKLRAKHQIDFEDMMIFTWELFNKRADILYAWQKKFAYILIDEFQDINRLQYEIIRLLAAPKNNLFIVGDDDQSIYRFRGAKPEIMLGFPKDYPQAKIIVLDVNYRCGKPIVDCAQRVIGHNKERYEKKLRAFKQDGKPVIVKRFASIYEEYQALMQQIQTLHEKEGIAYQQIAVLYRTNTGARQLAACLMEYQVPFRMKDTLPNLFEHWIAKDWIAYIKIALGDGSRSDYLRILNHPNRYISRQVISEACASKDIWGTLKDRYAGKAWMVERVERLEYDLACIGRMRPYAAVSYIRYAMDYDTFLRDYAKDHRIEEGDLIETADDIQESAKTFRTFREWFSYMDEYAQMLQEKKQRQKDDVQEDAVILSTMHSAKGLEYEAVFIVDANEGVMPHKKAVLDPDVEEERRMFYVAMTRAKQILQIYYTAQRYHKPAARSRFVEEIFENA